MVRLTTGTGNTCPSYHIARSNGRAWPKADGGYRKPGQQSPARSYIAHRGAVHVIQRKHGYGGIGRIRTEWEKDTSIEQSWRNAHDVHSIRPDGAPLVVRRHRRTQGERRNVASEDLSDGSYWRNGMGELGCRYDRRWPDIYRSPLQRRSAGDRTTSYRRSGLWSARLDRRAEGRLRTQRPDILLPGQRRCLYGLQR